MAACALLAGGGCGGAASPAGPMEGEMGGAGGAGGMAGSPLATGGASGSKGAGDPPVSRDASPATAGDSAHPEGIADTAVAGSPGDASAPDGMPSLPPPGPAPGGWTPTKLPGLAFWLDAGSQVTLEGGKASVWKDLSANHNDALQKTASAQPTPVPNALNGRAVLRFTQHPATYLSIADSETLQWGTGDFTVAVVFSHKNQPQSGNGAHLAGWGMFLNKITQPSGPRVGWGIMANWPTSETAPVRTVIGCETTEAGGSINSKLTGYNDGKARLWAMRRVIAKKKVELRRNGVVDSSSGAGPLLANVDEKGNPVTIGGMRSRPTSGAGFNLDGDIAEIVAVKGALSDEDVGYLESYLMAKYALTE